MVALGGGRQRDGDVIDPSVGFSRLAHIGDPVGPGRPIGRVHAARRGRGAGRGQALQAAYQGGGEGDPPPLIHERVT